MRRNDRPANINSIARKIIDDLWLKNRNFCSTDYDYCLDYLRRILPFNIQTFQCEAHDQGWTIPPKWDLIEGTISFKGNRIFSATSPLQIICLSQAFQGTVSLEELKKHLHFDKRFSDATPYHFRQNYRPWERDWGFCVSKQFFDSLQEGAYEVSIATKESSGYLNVAEWTKKGKNSRSFVFVAHLDHGGMANDDLAGVAVGIDFFKRLSARKTKFSYRLVIVQEIIGSYFYLKHTPRTDILESCFLEMLGSATPLALQASYHGSSYLEHVLAAVMQDSGIDWRKGGFREIICNDEIIWESLGIPMASLSRFPYPEYHSDKDCPKIITDHSLEEAIFVLEKAIERIEASHLICKKFQGVVGLSHPAYQLYVDPGQPAFDHNIGLQQQKLRNVMDLIPLMPNHIFAEQLASQLQLPLENILNYLARWEEKNLIKII